MKFEDSIAVLVEGIVKALGPAAEDHVKLRGLLGDRGMRQREKIEVMLEVVLEVLENRGGMDGGDSNQVLKELKALRSDFSDLVGKLENLKIKVPSSVVQGGDGVTLRQELIDVQSALEALKAEQSKSKVIKRLWWMIGVLVVVIAGLSFWVWA